MQYLVLDSGKRYFITYHTHAERSWITNGNQGTEKGVTLREAGGL